MKTILTDNQLMESMSNYINLYEWAYDIGYNPTETGLSKIIKTFKENKADLISLFEKSPHYNGRYQIVLKDETYQRKVDSNKIYSFANILRTYLPPRECLDFTKHNIFVTQTKGDDVYGITNRSSLLKVEKIMSSSEMEVTVVGHINNRYLLDSFSVSPIYFESISPEDFVKEKKKKGYEVYFANTDKYEIVTDCKHLQEKYKKEKIIFSDNLYKNATNNLRNKMISIINLIEIIHEQYLTENQANDFNTYFPELKAREGQKTTRVVNKFCTNIMKLKKEKGSTFASAFSSYCDAINPLSTPRWTILSIHPTDFLAMSNGYDWGSCHTLNKLRDDGNYYNGCNSSGVLSYLMDGVSFVFYTVQREYDGNEFETQPKMTRCMFHYGEDKIIQGRVYPQDNDGVNAVYKEIRPIAQRVIAEILNIPNLWRNSKGISECSAVSVNTGTHYPDILNFENCNVSYYGSSDSGIEKNTRQIIIGHRPICPRCGCSHTNCNNILCDSCQHELRSETERKGEYPLW